MLSVQIQLSCPLSTAVPTEIPFPCQRWESLSVHPVLSQRASEASPLHRSFEEHLHLQSMLTPSPDCSGLVVEKDRPGCLRCRQQQRPHRAHSKHIMSSSGGSGHRLSLCRSRTPEHVNSRKNSSRTKPHTETSGLGEGDSRRSWHRGERKEIRGTARLQPSAIKETLHRPLKWQKALVVCSGCDLQLPSSTAWLRRQRRWNSSMTTAAPYRPL